MGAGGTRIMASLLYAVRAVDAATTFRALEPLADRVDALLHRAGGEAETDACSPVPGSGRWLTWSPSQAATGIWAGCTGCGRSRAEGTR